MINAVPLDSLEVQRVRTVVTYDLDYSRIRNEYNDLLQLARFVTQGRSVFLNIIDAHYVWVVTSGNDDLQCFDKEETVCQHTVRQQSPVEIPNLMLDARFGHLAHVRNFSIRYYYGQPLQTSFGVNLGVLCTVDTATTPLTDAQKEALRLISRQIIERLERNYQLDTLKMRNNLVEKQKRMLAHDIRGPVGGLIGLANLGLQEIKDGHFDDLKQYFTLIGDSGMELLEMAEDLLRKTEKTAFDETITLSALKYKMECLFMPKVLDKHLSYKSTISEGTADIPFQKGNIQQILGNLLSNAVKFTPSGGSITLDLELTESQPRQLSVIVSDTGTGIDQNTIEKILCKEPQSVLGTDGESGYGMGLALVQHLVADMNGKLTIKSDIGAGSNFTILIDL